jgi:hypothetical protein
VAKIMNRNFVNIKIDREERPDVDKVYMTFVQVTEFPTSLIDLFSGTSTLPKFKVHLPIVVATVV